MVPRTHQLEFTGCERALHSSRYVCGFCEHTFISPIKAQQVTQSVVVGRWRVQGIYVHGFVQSRSLQLSEQQDQSEMGRALS